MALACDPFPDHINMQKFLMPFSLIYKVYYLFAFSLSLAILYPLFLFFLHKPERHPKAFKAMRFWAYILQVLAITPLKVKGGKTLPVNQPFIICPNHSSFMDIACLYIIFKNYFIFTGKKEIEKWPLFHIFYTKGMNITVDRNDRASGFKAFKRMFTVLENKNPLVIFPEGTISKHAPQLTDFKEGAFNLAIKAQVPIVPVTFLTNWKRLQRKGWLDGRAGPGLSHIVIHDPVYTNGLNQNDAPELLQKVREIIEQPLVERYGSFRIKRA